MSLSHLSPQFTGISPRVDSAMRGRYLAEVPAEQLLSELDNLVPMQVAAKSKATSRSNRGLSPEQQRGRAAMHQRFLDLEKELALRLKEMTHTAAKGLATLMAKLENYTCASESQLEDALVEALSRPDAKPNA